MTGKNTEQEERPCLHCLFVDVLDQFYEEYPTDEDGVIDTNEVIDAVAKTVAEMTAGQDKATCKEIIDRLIREIMNYDDEYRQQDASGANSGARH